MPIINNRSKGVHLTGVAVVLVAVFQFERSLAVPGLFQMAKAAFPDSPLEFFFILNIVFLLFEIILGFYLLKLKEWARRGLLILVAVYLVLTLMTVFVLRKDWPGLANDILKTWEFRNLERKILLNEKVRVSQEKIEQTEETRQAVLADQKHREPMAYPPPRTGIKFNFLFVSGILLSRFILWYFVLAIFLTRPSVKDQFKWKPTDKPVVRGR